MTLRDVTLGALKLVTVVLFLTSISLLTTALTVLSSFISQGVLRDWYFFLFWEIAAYSLQIFLTVIVWVYAKNIVQRLTPEASPERTLAVDEKWMSPVIGITGIVMVIMSIRGISVVGRLLYGTPSPQGLIVFYGHLITTFIQIALGIGLYFGARQISDKLQSNLKARLKVETASE
jgi:hypothetical protein